MGSATPPLSPSGSFTLGYRHLSDDENDLFPSISPYRGSRCRNFIEIGAILVEGGLAIGGYMWGGASKAVKVAAACMGGNALQLGMNRTLPLDEQRFIILEQFAAMNGLYYLLETLFLNFADSASPAHSPIGAALALEINVTLAAMVVTSVVSTYWNKKSQEIDLLATTERGASVNNDSTQQQLSLYFDSDRWEKILNTAWITLGIIFCSTNYLIKGDEGKILQYAGPYCISSSLGSIAGRTFKISLSKMEMHLLTQRRHSHSRTGSIGDVSPSVTLKICRASEAILDVASPICSGLLFAIPDTSPITVLFNATGVGFLAGLNLSIKSHNFTNTKPSELKDTRLNPLGKKSKFSEGSEIHKPIFTYHILRNVIESGGLGFLVQSITRDPTISLGAKAGLITSIGAYCLFRMGKIYRSKDIRSIIPGIGPLVWVDVQVLKDPAASDVLKLSYTAFTVTWILMRYFSDHINRSFKPGESSRGKTHAFFLLNHIPERLALPILVTQYLGILIDNKTLDQVTLSQVFTPLLSWIGFGASLANVPLNQFPKVPLVFTARWVENYLRIKDPL